MPTHTRVLSTQAPGRSEAISNKQSPPINRYFNCDNCIDNKYERQQSICPLLYSNSKQYAYTYKRSIVKHRSPPVRPTAAFNKKRPFINWYSSTKSTRCLITEILYQMTNTNDNNQYALPGNTPTPSNTPTHTRVLSTQAPGWSEAPFNEQSLTNIYHTNEI